MFISNTIFLHRYMFTRQLSHGRSVLRPQDAFARVTAGHPRETQETTDAVLPVHDRGAGQRCRRPSAAAAAAGGEGDRRQMGDGRREAEANLHGQVQEGASMLAPKKY